MNFKRLLILFIILLFINILIIFIIVFLKPTIADRDLPEIRKDNILNIVSEHDSTHLQVIDDYPALFQAELCQYIAQRSGLKVQHHFEKDLETAIRKLENNIYDVIAHNIQITNENREIFAFTVPIGYSKQVLVQRKNNDSDSILFISTQLDLANQTIFVTKNSPAILRLKNLSEEIAEPIYIKEIPDFTTEQLFYMLTNKEIDYMATDLDTALKNTGLFPDLDFGTDISFTQLQAWALRKNSPVLLDSLNVWITEFKDSHTGK